jgi:predicted porin
MRYPPFFLGIVLLLSLPVIAWGNEFRIVPSVSVKEEYNSNIFFSTADIKEDYITTLSPGLEMVNRTERLDTDLLARLGRLDYSNNRGLNATNQAYNGKARYQISPLFGVSAEAGYVKNSNPTLNVDTTGIVTVTAPWNRISSALSANYQFTEKTAAVASYSYGRDYYDMPGYLDDVSHDVNAGFVHDLGQYLPAVKGRVNMGYSYYYFPDSLTESVMGTVGFSKDFSEIWSIHVDGGSRITSSKITVTQLVPSAYVVVNGQAIPFGYHPARVELSNDGWGWVAKASLNWRGEQGNGDLTFNRDITPAYGLNGAAERNALTLSTRYRFTHELSMLFTTGYSSLRSDPSEFSAQAIDQRTSYINAGVRYDFTKDSYLDTSYEYTRVEYRLSNTAANRQLISIRFYIQHSFFEWI